MSYCYLLVTKLAGIWCSSSGTIGSSSALTNITGTDFNL